MMASRSSTTARVSRNASAAPGDQQQRDHDQPDAGTLDVPAQGIKAMPLAGVGAEGGTVRFTVPDLPGGASFAGTLAADGSAIGGTFTQGGGEYPLVLRRGAAR
jgi:hypothetical protein